MKNKTLINLKLIAKILGLFLGILSVILYAELPFPLRLICWIPITLGYSFWFSNWFSNIIENSVNARKGKK